MKVTVLQIITIVFALIVITAISLALLYGVCVAGAFIFAQFGVGGLVLCTTVVLGSFMVAAK